MRDITAWMVGQTIAAYVCGPLGWQTLLTETVMLAVVSIIVFVARQTAEGRS